MIEFRATPVAGACLSELQKLYKEMEPAHLTPLWEVLSHLVPSEPSSPAKVHRWPFDEVRAFLVRAGELISAAEAERRVLILENPGLKGLSGITPSLYAGVQMLLPGENAPCHRHTQCALRFVLEGTGAYTSVDGEKAVMQPFDLVLTPGGRWHDHGNDTSAPSIWLDGLDIPTVRHFDAGFAEKFSQLQHPETAAPGDSRVRYGKNMRPLRGGAADQVSPPQPLFHYPYREWSSALREMARTAEIDPHLGHALEFINPADGGPVMPTISAHVRLLPNGFETRARQSTDGTVFIVVEGRGTASVGAQTLSLSERDIFVLPAWTPLVVHADSDLILFGFSDKAAQEKLGLYREECA